MSPWDPDLRGHFEYELTGVEVAVRGASGRTYNLAATGMDMRAALNDVRRNFGKGSPTTSEFTLHVTGVQDISLAVDYDRVHTYPPPRNTQVGGATVPFTVTQTPAPAPVTQLAVRRRTKWRRRAA